MERQRLEPTIFSGKGEYRLNQNALLAFSYGPASCVGKQLAWIEMRMVICLLMKHFGLKFVPEYNPLQYEDDMRDYYLTIKGSLPAILSLRK